jgi:hypothetical protein
VSRAAPAASEFFAPAPLAAVALLALNDHLLKARFHDAFTGKLSDVALCFFLPLLVSALLRPFWPAHRPRLAFAAALAALGFVTLELSLTADAWLSAAVAAVGTPFGLRGVAFTRDVSDLLALAVVPVAYAYGRRRLATTEAPPSRVLRALALSATLVLLGATSPPYGSCQHESALRPNTFRVEGTCGPSGIVVIAVDDNSRVVAQGGERVFGATRGSSYVSWCGFDPSTDDWSLEAPVCVSPSLDGSAPDAAPSRDASGDPLRPADAAPFCLMGQRVCTVTHEADGLWVTCRQPGASACRSLLTLTEAP